MLFLPPKFTHSDVPKRFSQTDTQFRNKAHPRTLLTWKLSYTMLKLLQDFLMLCAKTRTHHSTHRKSDDEIQMWSADLNISHTSSKQNSRYSQALQRDLCDCRQVAECVKRVLGQMWHSGTASVQETAWNFQRVMLALPNTGQKPQTATSDHFR